jgi:uncharacterized phage protein (TIGR01671 family)
MKELRFRAWYGKNFVYFSLGETNRYPSNVMDFPVNQYTGLKDMNGKEIYHKDIIKCLPSGIYGVVEWIEELGTFTLQTIGNEYDTTVYGTQIEGKNITREVVGNVYENPEYL